MDESCNGSQAEQAAQKRLGQCGQENKFTKSIVESIVYYDSLMTQDFLTHIMEAMQITIVY